MRVGQIYEILNNISPFELQESWDNSGLQVGTFNDKVKKVCLSLDVDRSLLKSLEKNTLIITHHPLIFKGLKAFNPSSYPTSLIKMMIKKNISLIAMHTNFDKTHLNLHVGTKVLGFEVIKNEDFCLYLKVDKSFDDLCKHVKKCLKIKHLRVVNGKKFIKNAVLTTGSGGDFIEHMDADCFLTGDIKYHQAMEAKENNLALIDICHYESECHFVDALEQELKNFPLNVKMANSKNPFKYK